LGGAEASWKGAQQNLQIVEVIGFKRTQLQSKLNVMGFHYIFIYKLLWFATAKFI
jgi:hypothetical protein